MEAERLATALADGDSLRYYPAYDLPGREQLTPQAGTTVADDGTVMEAFTAAISEQIEAKAQKANKTFEDRYAAAVRHGAVSALPGAQDTIARLRDRDVRVCLATGFSPVTRDTIIGQLGWGGLVDLVLAPANAGFLGRGRPWPGLPLIADILRYIEEPA